MSVTGVFLLPLMSKSFYRKLLSALIGLAVGSLLGEDVFSIQYKPLMKSPLTKFIWL